MTGERQPEDADGVPASRRITRRNVIAGAAISAAALPLGIRIFRGEKAALTPYAHVPPSEIADNPARIREWFYKESRVFEAFAKSKEARDVFDGVSRDKSDAIFSALVEKMPHITEVQAEKAGFNPGNVSMALRGEGRGERYYGNGVKLQLQEKTVGVGTAKHVADLLPRVTSWTIALSGDAAVGPLKNDAYPNTLAVFPLSERPQLRDVHGKTCVSKGEYRDGRTALFVGNAVEVTDSFIDWVLDHLDYYNSFTFLTGLFGSALRQMSIDDVKHTMRGFLRDNGTVCFLTPHNVARPKWFGAADAHGLSGAPTFTQSEGEEPALFGVYRAGCVVRVNGRAYSLGFASNALYDAIANYRQGRGKTSP